MDTGYQIEPERVGRTRSRRWPALVVAIAILLAVVVAKPWAGPDQRPGQAATTLVGVAAASPRPAATDTPPVAEPGWPAPSGPTAAATLASTQAEGALEMLEARRGTWGVGATGVGPRLIREDPWSDWAAIEPVVLTGPAQDGLARHIPIRPGSGLCTGLPTIYDHPTVVAITMPTTSEPGSSLDGRWAGWWTDGGRTASIDASVGLVATSDGPGIAAVERNDRAPWPAGLYEFQVRTRDRTFDLTFCLTRHA